MNSSRRSFLRLSTAAVFASLYPSLSSAAVADSALCRKLASDPLRPRYHLLPAHNWMNDPNGPIFCNGRYHMFHQYNPKAAVWGDMNWAHATSLDMIHWKHEPIAISPTPGGPDQDGVFSGSTVLDNGSPTVIYTGVAPPASAAEITLDDGRHKWKETQCLAVAQDNDLRTWKKLPQPVIAAPPAGLKVTGFRDPAMWREGDKWMLILGSGTHGKGGMILLYTSSNLRDWTYLHPLVEGSPSGRVTTNPVDTGDMWECPEFFPLANKHVLLISTMGNVRWKVGTYANQRFTPEKEGVVDWGSYYAAKTMLDRDGNRILWGWIPETRPDSELIAAGWAGAMSLPRVLSVNSRNELQTEVAPAARVLRTSHTGMANLERRPTAEKIIRDIMIRDLSAEIDLLVRPKIDAFVLRLRSEHEEFAVISCSKESGGRQLRVNTISAPLAGAPGSEVRLHMFLDGSVLEVFADELTALTVRIYEVPSGPLHLKLGGDAQLITLDFWPMKPISRDRLTQFLCG